MLIRIATATLFSLTATLAYCDNLIVADQADQPHNATGETAPSDVGSLLDFPTNTTFENIVVWSFNRSGSVLSAESKNGASGIAITYYGPRTLRVENDAASRTGGFQTLRWDDVLRQLRWE